MVVSEQVPTLEAEEEARRFIHELWLNLGGGNEPLQDDFRLSDELDRIDSGPFFPTAFRVPKKTRFMWEIERHFFIVFPRTDWKKSWTLAGLSTRISERVAKPQLNLSLAHRKVNEAKGILFLVVLLATLAIAAFAFGWPKIVRFVLPVLLIVMTVPHLGAVKQIVHYHRIIRLRG